jgi:hypothetical protein
MTLQQVRQAMDQKSMCCKKDHWPTVEKVLPPLLLQKEDHTFNLLLNKNAWC